MGSVEVDGDGAKHSVEVSLVSTLLKCKSNLFTINVYHCD